MVNPFEQRAQQLQTTPAEVQHRGDPQNPPRVLQPPNPFEQRMARQQIQDVGVGNWEQELADFHRSLSVADPADVPPYEAPPAGDTLLARFGKGVYNRLVTEALKPDVTISMLREANHLADQRASEQARKEFEIAVFEAGDQARRQGRELDSSDFKRLERQYLTDRQFALFQKYSDQEQKALFRPGWAEHIRRGDPIPEAPELPETRGEMVTDIAAGTLSFFAKAAVLRRANPTMSTAALFETINLSEGGTPGRGLAMGSMFSLAKGLPGGQLMRKIGEPSAVGTVFATTTAIEGGDATDCAVAFALPFMMRAAQRIKVPSHKLTQHRHIQVRKTKSAMRSAGLDPDRIPKSSYDKLWSMAGRTRELEKALKAGRITPVQFQQEMNAIGGQVYNEKIDMFRRGGYRVPVKSHEVGTPKAQAPPTPTSPPGRPARGPGAAVTRQGVDARAVDQKVADWRQQATEAAQGGHTSLSDALRYLADQAESGEYVPPEAQTGPSTPLGPSVGRTYEAAKMGSAADQNIFVENAPQAPAGPDQRHMAVQFSSDLLTEGTEDPLARRYFDLLHEMRDGYAIPGDTWEIPAWIPTLANIDPTADVGIVRDPDTFVQQAVDRGYNTLYFSALDVNKERIRDIAERFPGKIVVGGYVDKDFFAGLPNVRFYDSMKSMAEGEQLPFRPGQDYRHFTGTKTQPRLCLSGGCLHKCAFCTVDKKLTKRSREDIMGQVDSLRDAGMEFRYVYLDDKTFGQAENWEMINDIQNQIRQFNPNFDGFIIQTTAGQFNKMDPVRLARSGVRLVEIGVESFNDPILRKYHKPASEKSIERAAETIRQSGMKFIPNIMIGLPEETGETYNRTLDFLRRHDDIISHVNVTNLAVYGNTELGQEIEIDTRTDVNQNAVVKSFHDNPQVHIDFAEQVYQFGIEQVQKDIVPRIKPTIRVEGAVHDDIPPAEPHLTPDPVQRKFSKVYKQKAHEYAKQLGLDEESRRQINQQVGGHRSMTHMSLEQQRDTMNTLRTMLEDEKPQYRRPDVVDALGFRSSKYAAVRMGVEPLLRPLAEGTSRYKAERREVTKARDEVLNAYRKDTEGVDEEMLWELLNTHREPPNWLVGKPRELFNFVNDMRKDMLRRMNESRAARGDDPIPDEYAYMQRVLKPDTVRAIMNGELEMPKNTATWMRGVKQVFNPQELERRLDEEVEGLFSHDIKYVTDNMLRNSLRDIHLAEPKQLLDHILTGRVHDIDRAKLPHDLQKHVDHASEMPAETREWVQDIVAHVFEGEQTAWDERVDRNVREALDGLEGYLNQFGMTMGERPATRLLQALGTLVHHGALGPRPKLMIRNKFQTLQNLGLYGADATFQALTSPNPEMLNELLERSSFLHDYGTEAWIDEDLATRIGRTYMAPYRWTAVTNAKKAMETAWHGTLPLFTDPQYKDHGWASPERTYDEPKNFLYPVEQERMLLEMEHGAGASQYGYTLWEAPQIFQHRTLGPISKLQSWPMNYWTRYTAEMKHRAFHGSPSWNPSLKLPMQHRIRPLQYLLIGGATLSALGYGRSFLFGTAPSGLPPTAQAMMSAYQYAIHAFQDTPYANRRKNQAKWQLKNSLLMHVPGYLTAKDAMAFREAWKGERPWSDLFFYKKLLDSGEQPTTPGRKAP